MIKLKVIENDNDNYKLVNNEGNIFDMTLQFFDIENDEKPNVNDYINISAELLNPRYIEYSSSLVFGGLNNICGKENISLNDIDVIKVEVKDKEIYLKRLYG